MTNEKMEFIRKKMKAIKKHDRTEYEYNGKPERPKAPRELAQDVLNRLED